MSAKQNPVTALTAEDIANIPRDTEGAPALLLGYQIAWIADQAQVKIGEKSRRIGLSWAEASDCALTACTARGEGGMNCYYLSYNHEMTQQFIRDCAFWIKVYGLAADAPREEIVKDEDKDILTYVIRCASGFEIRALPSRPTAIRSKQGKVVLDEAAFVEDLDEILKAALALLMWGGRLVIISTHNGEDNPFNLLIEDCRAGKFPYSVHRFDFQDAVKEGLYQRICLTRGKEWTPEAEREWVAEVYRFYGEKASEELDVIPSQGSAVYLPRSLIERCMSADYEVITWRCPDEFTYAPQRVRETECQAWCDEHIQPLIARIDPLRANYYGSDFARSGDASIIAPCFEDAHLHVAVPCIIEMRNVPFAQQRQVLKYLVSRLARFMAGAMDATGNGAEMAEWAAQEFGSTRIAEVALTTEWYRQNMPRLRAAFEDGTITLPRHANVLADLRAVRKVKGVAKVPDDARERGADDEMRHGDIAVAIALLLYAIAEMEPVPMEFASTGMRPSVGFDQDAALIGRRTTDTGFGTVAGGNDFGGY